MTWKRSHKISRSYWKIWKRRAELKWKNFSINVHQKSDMYSQISPSSIRYPIVQPGKDHPENKNTQIKEEKLEEILTEIR